MNKCIVVIWRKNTTPIFGNTMIDIIDIKDTKKTKHIKLPDYSKVVYQNGVFSNLEMPDLDPLELLNDKTKFDAFIKQHTDKEYEIRYREHFNTALEFNNDYITATKNAIVLIRNNAIAYYSKDITILA